MVVFSCFEGVFRKALLTSTGKALARAAGDAVLEDYVQESGNKIHLKPLGQNWGWSCGMHGERNMFNFDECVYRNKVGIFYYCRGRAQENGNMKHFGTISPYVFRLLAWNKKIKMNDVLKKVTVFSKKMPHLSRSFGVSKWKYLGLFPRKSNHGSPTS